MSPDELYRSLRAALDEEREGLRALDAAAVLRSGEVKERLLEVIRSTPGSEQPPLLAVLRELRPDLQRNLVLLAHARDCLRERTLLRGAQARRPRLRAEL